MVDRGGKNSLNELLLESVNRITVERVINLALSKSFTRNGEIAIEQLKNKWLHNIAELKGHRTTERIEQRVASIPHRLAERVQPLDHVFGCVGRPSRFMAKPKEHNDSFRGQVFAIRKVCFDLF
jgi:hypothetical protein